MTKAATVCFWLVYLLPVLTAFILNQTRNHPYPNLIMKKPVRGRVRPVIPSSALEQETDELIWLQSHKLKSEHVCPSCVCCPLSSLACQMLMFCHVPISCLTQCWIKCMCTCLFFPFIFFLFSFCVLSIFFNNLLPSGDNSTWCFLYFQYLPKMCFVL